MTHTLKYYPGHFLFYLGGDQPSVSWVERLQSFFGAFIGFMLVLTIAKYLGEQTGVDEWLTASLVASALLFLRIRKAPWPSLGRLLLATLWLH